MHVCVATIRFERPYSFSRSFAGNEENLVATHFARVPYNIVRSTKQYTHAFFQQYSVYTRSPGSVNMSEALPVAFS
jgi:hypothetical protein